MDDHGEEAHSLSKKRRIIVRSTEPASSSTGSCPVTLEVRQCRSFLDVDEGFAVRGSRYG